MFALPSTCGWTVEWDTIGKRTGKIIRDSFESTDKAEVERKAEELKRKGFKNVTISECVF